MLNEIKEKLKTRNLFITGGGGVGKSYYINQLRKELGLELTSSTGVSAVNIGGQTLHSWAGIGIGDVPIHIQLEKIARNRTKIKELQLADYLVIDEVSMLDAYTLDYVDEVLREVRQSPEAFGGLRTILVGDFFQLPPVKLGQVVQRAGVDVMVDYCFTSSAWKELDPYVIHLTKVYRQADSEFVQCLNNIRIGLPTEHDIALLQARELKPWEQPPADTTRLFATNSYADRENETHLNRLIGKEYTYEAVDNINAWLGNGFAMVSPDHPKLQPWDRQKYETFNKDCRVPRLLKLKIGARVMLLTNQYIHCGLGNGSCGYVTDLNERDVTVIFDNGVKIELEKETTEVRRGGRVSVSRLQFPLRLAYGLTVHRSQGLTLDRVLVEFDGTFAAGQIYVALSRVKSLDGLYIRNLTPDSIVADARVLKFYGVK